MRHTKQTKTNESRNAPLTEIWRLFHDGPHPGLWKRAIWISTAPPGATFCPSVLLLPVCLSAETQTQRSRRRSGMETPTTWCWLLFFTSEDLSFNNTIVLADGSKLSSPHPNWFYVVFMLWFLVNLLAGVLCMELLFSTWFDRKRSESMAKVLFSSLGKWN